MQCTAQAAGAGSPSVAEEEGRLAVEEEDSHPGGGTERAVAIGHSSVHVAA